MPFWERLYNMCMRKGCKPNAIVQATGLSTAAPAKWKKGAVPNGETLIKIADYLDCSVDYLLGRTDSPETVNPSKGNDTNYNAMNTTASNDNQEMQMIRNATISSLECAELVRIYNTLSIRQRVRLLTFAIELEEESLSKAVQ